MKKKIIIIISFLHFFIFSQNIINVNITQDCSAISGEYNYVGLYNNKKKYSKTFTNGSQTLLFSVMYKNNIWIIQNENNEEIGFYNNNLNGDLPPLNNWINSECDNGSMTIMIPLNTLNYKLLKTRFDYLANKIIVSKEDKLSKIEVLNNLGMKIKEFKTINEDIDLEELNSGVYFIILKSNLDYFEVIKIII